MRKDWINSTSANGPWGKLKRQGSHYFAARDEFDHNRETLVEIKRMGLQVLPHNTIEVMAAKIAADRLGISPHQVEIGEITAQEFADLSR